MKVFKYSLFYILLLLFIFVLSSCDLNLDDDEQIEIVTTIFPLYDFTKQIVKDKAEVTLILPPGVEPHSFDPKPRDIFTIRKADMFIYTGEFLEVWSTRMLDVLNEDEMVIISSSDGIDFHHGEEEEHEDEHEGHLHEGIDPHIWIDPHFAMKMIDNIVKGMIKIDPLNQSFYEQNAIDYKNQLEALDLAYQDLFENSEYNTIIFGGHFVFGYLAEHYDIHYVSPYRGFSPDTLPTPKKIQELIQIIKETGTKTIYYEELIDPKVARVIAEETKAVMLPLNGGGNISKTDYKNQMTYLSMMYENIENLKKGLNYNG